ncbi:hypothetical protein [Streptomyces sp900116325]|uniref:hypothetical protein n=1 Tax=Streptomyces sp. 900116325 TaxID=3154295 RepID=UPI0033A31FF9
MNPYEAPQQEPAEHVRFAAYLSELAQVTNAEETSLITKGLGDPDRTMAQSAVLRHLDRRATDLHLDPAFEPWTRAMAQVTADYPLLVRRLQEWAPSAISLGRPWNPAALLESSDWLQRKTAATASTEALRLLAQGGRTKRIRNTARTTLEQQSNH